jgi:hypothetical protein
MDASLDVRMIIIAAFASFFLRDTDRLIEAASRATTPPTCSCSRSLDSAAKQSAGVGVKRTKAFLLGFTAARMPVLIYVAWITWRIAEVISRRDDHL